ncbi:MAG: FimB/Mfa2 family fimbrial subunit [Bacteroidales bacterium]|nr:FimB/Mfa2 family fimbrial subunit [Bacteroidales bacterium]
MMNSKTLFLLLSAFMLLTGVSCKRQEKAPVESSVVITFSTGEVVTRAGDGVVTDGGGIMLDGSGNPDLFIAIVNYSGVIVSTYPSADPDDTEVLDSSSDTQVSVRFKNITNAGDYTVYAIANTGGGVWGAPTDWTTYTTAAALDALTFTELTGSDLPTVSDRMPISAKGTLSINEGMNGQVELELLRCVAKVGFKFKNETDETLTLNDCVVILEKINPTQGYLFPQTDDAAGTARNLNLISSSLTIGPGVTTDLYGNHLVFPSNAPARSIGSRYFCNISFTLGGVPKSFSELPVHDKRSQDIPSLERNQYLQIETRINRGLEISFNFVVLDWNQKNEDIIFH